MTPQFLRDILCRQLGVSREAMCSGRRETAKYRQLGYHLCVRMFPHANFNQFLGAFHQGDQRTGWQLVRIGEDKTWALRQEHPELDFYLDDFENNFTTECMKVG